MCFLILLINVMFLNLLLNSKCESLSKLPSFGCAQRISYEYLVRTENLTAEGNKTFTQGGKSEKNAYSLFLSCAAHAQCWINKILTLIKKKKKVVFPQKHVHSFPLYHPTYLCWNGAPNFPQILFHLTILSSTKRGVLTFCDITSFTLKM